MRDQGYNLGGEQSGHVILSDYATAGDGLLTALQILSILILKQKPASRVLKLFAPLPQVLRSVRLPSSTLKMPGVENIFENARKKLGKNGRLLVRPSGTEPLIRIMAEGKSQKLARDTVDSIVNALTSLSQKAVA